VKSGCNARIFLSPVFGHFGVKTAKNSLKSVKNAEKVREKCDFQVKIACKVRLAVYIMILLRLMMVCNGVA